MLLRLIALGGVALLGNAVQARGVSPYLPLQMSPEIERQIERLLILADQPVMQRPIAAATVLGALPRACERDVVLCQAGRALFERVHARSGYSPREPDGMPRPRANPSLLRTVTACARTARTRFRCPRICSRRTTCC